MCSCKKKLESSEVCFQRSFTVFILKRLLKKYEVEMNRPGGLRRGGEGSAQGRGSRGGALT